MLISTFNKLTENDLVTAVIAAINIFATISLTILNLLAANKFNKNNKKRAVFLKFYIPLKYKIQAIDNKFQEILKKQKDFDIFNYEYETDFESSSIKELRNELINNYYKDFLDFFNSNYDYYNKKLDNDLEKVYLHIQFMIFSYGKERLLIDNESKCKYQLPDFKKIIEIINKKIYLQ